MTTSVPIPKLNWENPDQIDAFCQWKDFMNSYFVIEKVQDKDKWHYLLLSSDEKGHELWRVWGLNDAQKEDPAVVFKKFEDHMVGTLNKWVMRLELSALEQKQGESIDNFVCRLKAKAGQCKFSDNTIRDEQITFQLIKGILWTDERKHLIKKGNALTLEDAIKSAQTYQATMENTSSFSKGASASASINSFNSRGRHHGCSFCGETHGRGKCPAYGTVCSKCGLKNHFAKVCRNSRDQSTEKPKARSKSRGRDHKSARSKSRGRKNNKKDEKQVHYVESDDVLDCGELTISDISANERQSIMVKLQAKPPDVQQKVNLTVKADTGANGNVLPLRCVAQMYPNDPNREKRLKPSSVTLTAVNGTKIEHYGTLDIPLKFDDSDWQFARFFVCDTSGPAILSCDLCEKLGIICIPKSKSISVVNKDNVKSNDKNVKSNVKNENVKSNDRNVKIVKHERVKDCNDPCVNDDCLNVRNTDELKKLYPECFEGIGHFPQKYKIVLKDDAIPVVSPPRKYPIQLKDEICNAIYEMEKLGVVKKCKDDDPCEWVNSLAFSRKSSGALRVCLDPRNLNKAIKRTYHKVPTLEEISHEFANSTVFSKLDAKHGYWSIELDDESSHYCTFNSPAGKFRFCRLPFGLCVSQDIFQKYMDDILRKAGNGVIGIADDVVVHGKTVIEHNKALRNLMNAAKEYGLVFRSEKCDILKDSIEFYGLVWSREGMKPDAKKCDDIRSRPAPQNRSELQSFLGLIQYLSAFIPHLSAKTCTLRQLLKQNTEWCWESEHQQAFKSLQEAISEDMKLRYFDPNKPAEIEVDASLLGLGAALVQEGKPVAFASKALTPAESNYANIEREMLAVVYGLEKFHTFVFGKPLVVFSDHKPLEQIMLKPLSMTPPRLQRMLLRTQPYDVVLKYRPGKEMVYADYLSRIRPSPGEAVRLEQAIHMVQISASQLDKVRLSSENDAEMTVLRDQIVSGWPSQAKSVPRIIRPYFSMRDYLSIENGVLYAGPRMIIPSNLREEFLSRIHASHQGVTKSQLRAKDSVYWPKMMSDIEELVGKCDTCKRNAKSNKKEPMIGHEIPTQPWQILSSDLFELEGHQYVLVVDHFSKMPFARHLKSTSSGEVVKFCKDLFAVHGVPQRLYSDNGPQYSSVEFRNFSLDWEFEHITSSPHYPQSNGFAERYVGIVKDTLLKAKQSGVDPQMALLCLRSTPLDCRTPSPAELLYGRKIRANLPVQQELQLSRLNDYDNSIDRQQVSAEYYNRNAGNELSILSPGDKIYVQETGNSKTWKPGIVQRKCNEPRSYLVKMPNGSVTRRNRRFIQTRNVGKDTNDIVNESSDDNVVSHNDDSCPGTVKKKVRFECSNDVNDSSTSVTEPRRSSRITAKPTRLIEEC